MKDIIGFEGKYAITENGQVWSYHSQRFLKQTKRGKYMKVNLSNGNNSVSVHRLVAEAYVPNPNGYDTVDHIDGNTLNNNASNLQWLPRSENAAKANSKKVYCVELDKVYPSATAAAKEVNVSQVQISKVCRGEGRTAAGYHWKYV